VIRPSTWLFAAAVVVVGYVMFQVKYEVIQQEETLARLNREIAASREASRVLAAEWSYLTQPSRLADLAKRYLDLAPISTAQLGGLDSIPLRDPAAAAASAPAPAVRLTPPVPPAARPGARLAAFQPSVEP